MFDSAGTKDRAAPERHCPQGCVDERALQRVIGAASDLALFVDQDGVIQGVEVGEALKAYPGWDSLIGKRWSETTLKDSQSKVERLLTEARSGTTARSREINQQTAGAGDVPLRFSAVRLDATQRVVALGRDLSPMASVQQQMISAQQAMDREHERQRQAEARYRLLFQVCSEGALVAEASHLRILESNPAAAGLLEESAHDLQGRTLPDLFGAKNWPQVQALIAAVEAGGRPSELVVGLARLQRKVAVAVSLFRQSGVLMVLLRLRAAGTHAGALGGQGADERGARMLAALDALPDGFVVMGEDRRILSANPAFCEMIQQANENQILGQPLERWLGRPGVDLNIMLANLREHGSIRNFATVVNDSYGSALEAVVSAVAVPEHRVPCTAFSIRTMPLRITGATAVGAGAGAGLPMPRSIEQMRELVGRVSLKEIVRESADLIERLCIEAALKVSGDNRASAAQLLGLSRQSLYLKLRRHGLGDLDPSELD
ncbi:MAG: transcriptional regulator PpsR [Polyangia bacterium]